jgi:dolichyl-phosphate beta-glucosyltransferase
VSDPALAAYRKWETTPLTERPKYSIVVPAYNEEWRILPTIGAIATQMCTLGEPWELIVADDGSTDTTVKLVSELGLVNLHLLIADKNGGKGSAVRRGMLRARGDIVLFADADQSTPIEQFESLKKLIDEGFDVVVGSRAVEGAEVESKSFLRKVFSSGLNFIVRRIFQIPVADTQCGFKMFTADAADRLFRRQLIDEFSFDLEILYLAQKFDMKTAEVPVRWIDAPGSKVEAGKVALEFLRDLAIIRWNDVRGRYDADNHPRPDAAPASSSPEPDS